MLWSDQVKGQYKGGKVIKVLIHSSNKEDKYSFMLRVKKVRNEI